MTKIKFHYLFILAFFITLASCHKDQTVTPVNTPTATRAGVYILNQGNYGTNNSSLTYYDYTSKLLTADIFSAANSGAKLGNTGNDAQIYGSKMYIVVNVSSVVDIVNAKTGKFIKQDSLVTANHVARQPRSIAFYKSNAFITSYDGTVAVMDTTTLTISQYITVGRNPEQLAVANGKLYVANGGGLSYPNVDKTVSVIDLATLTVIKTLTVGSNPYAVSVDSYGDVFVTAYGVYPASPTLSIINSTNDVVATSNFTGGPFAMIGDNAYYITSTGGVGVYNVKTAVFASGNFITDGTTFTAAYAIAADPLTGEVFVTDAKDYASNGTLTAFDKTGKKEYSLITGVNPGTITFVNK